MKSRTHANNLYFIYIGAKVNQCGQRMRQTTTDIQMPTPTCYTHAHQRLYLQMSVKPKQASPPSNTTSSFTSSSPLLPSSSKRVTAIGPVVQQHELLLTQVLSVINVPACMCMHVWVFVFPFLHVRLQVPKLLALSTWLRIYHHARLHSYTYHVRIRTLPAVTSVLRDGHITRGRRGGRRRSSG